MVIHLEYVSLSDCVGVIPLRTNIGIVCHNDSCVIIDTGLDEKAGKHIFKTAQELGLKIKAIVNTHSHSDHYGGNVFLKGKTDALVYAPSREALVIENPWLEPLWFSCGASVFEGLRNKFLMAEACKVDVPITKGRFEIEGISLEAVPLPGHSIGMTGVLSNRTLFCGDALFGEEIIEKHKVLYLHDPDEARKSLNKLLEVDCEFIVPSHGTAVKAQDIQRCVEVNVNAIDSFDSVIIKSLTGSMGVEELTSRALTAVGLTLDDLTKMMLMRSTVLAHVTCLARRGLIKVSVGQAESSLVNRIVCSPV